MERIHTIGRRKTSIARIYLNKQGNGKINIKKNNDKLKKNKPKILSYKDYFANDLLIEHILRIFIITDTLNKYDLLIKVNGGGIKGQTEAIGLAIARALCIIDSNHRNILKNQGFLTRDSRIVERKKFGRKKARKCFQFSKR